MTQPGGIVSLADTKRQLGIDPTYTVNDDELSMWITGMTGPVERYKNETVVLRQFTYGEDKYRPRRLRLRKVPVVSLDALSGNAMGFVTTYDTTSTVTANQFGAYWVEPETGRVKQNGVGPPLAGFLTVTQTAGYQIIPQHIYIACLLLIQALWESRRGPGGIGGVIGPEELQDYRHYEALPRKVREILGAPRPVIY